MPLPTEHIVKLLRIPGFSRAKVLRLAARINDVPADNMGLAHLVLGNLDSLSIPAIGKESLVKAFDIGERALDQSKQAGIDFVSFFDPAYPELLRGIIDPPVLLNVIGDVAKLSNVPAIAVVGTRKPTDYGRGIAERVGQRLGSDGINVVSGLAHGCDTAAHLGCLTEGGKTTAVLGHGLDMIYPPENRKLADRIVESGGLLVSEYLIGMTPLPVFFVERDRIQAGLSKATVIVETDVNGGTMHTASFAHRFKRVLAVINHPVDRQTDSSRGNRFLLTRPYVMSLRSKEDMDQLLRRVRFEQKRDVKVRR